VTAELVPVALARWPLRFKQHELAAQRENHVYRAVTEGGLVFALRFHRPGYRSDQELHSELQWMAMLEQSGLEVPRPVLTTAQQYVEHVGRYQVDLLTWLPGIPFGKVGEPLKITSNRAEAFFSIGEMLAHLHAASDAWDKPSGFSRPRWDIDGLVGSEPLWDRYWENPLLSADEKALFLRARDKARARLLEIEESLDFGLIHADAARENLLLEGNRVRVIDFDDGGWGFRLFDIATALLKDSEEPDYEDLKASLLAGYASRRHIDLTELPMFMMLRALTYPGWMITRLGEPGAEARNLRHVRIALGQVRRWIT
jgi:Ser/Thr protein kinase RdoA (MazF antagonist)